jgi:cystathionine gamma-synthase
MVEVLSLIGGELETLPAMSTASKAPASTSRSFDTLAVRGGEPRSHGYHAVTVPIVCSATYSFESSQAIADYFEGKTARGEYGRYGNPTVEMAEAKLAALEGAQAAVLFPSGMNAITTLLLAMLKPGDHVIMTSDCYRRTRQFLTTTMAKFGVRHSFVAPDNIAALRAAVEPGRTRLIITEAPTNPYLRVADIAQFAEVKREHPGIKLLVDATLATPVVFRPLAFGADFVLHSCTKYLAGHNDVLSGAICGASPLVAALRDARGVFGGMPDPHGAYLLVRGLKTLAVRMRQHNQNAQAVANFLERHGAVERVFYPGLASHADHKPAAAQFTGGYGGVVSFRVRGELQRTAAFVDRTRLPIIGPSMGGVESLIEQPALMSFYELTTQQREAIGIFDNLVRLSVGLEDVTELMADLDQALNGEVETSAP